MARHDDDDQGTVGTVTVAEGTTENEVHTGATQTAMTGDSGAGQGTDQAGTDQADDTAKAEKPAGPTDEEIKAAVAKFEDTLDSVFDDQRNDGGRDAGTGVLSEALLERVRTAYSDLPSGNTVNSARPLAKKLVEGRMAEAMDAMDVQKARTYYVIQQEALTVKGGRQPAAQVVVNPTEAHVDRMTALWLAPYLVPVPDGVAGDWAAQVEAKAAELTDPAKAYMAWVVSTDENKGDEPEVSPVIKSAVRIALGRGTGGRPAKARTGGGGSSEPRVSSGLRRNIATHITEAFAQHPVGTILTLSEIANFKSTEYGDDKPSQGALAARIYNDKGCTVEGIEPAEREGKKGARRVA